jgi:hypothetical protein
MMTDALFETVLLRMRRQHANSTARAPNGNLGSSYFGLFSHRLIG